MLYDRAMLTRSPLPRAGRCFPLLATLLLTGTTAHGETVSPSSVSSAMAQTSLPPAESTPPGKPTQSAGHTVRTVGSSTPSAHRPASPGLSPLPVPGNDSPHPHGTLTGSGPAILPTSEQHWITSSHTGRRYRIQTTITGPAPESGYPVFYTLDGDTLFAVAAMAAHALTTRTGENGVEPMLIVGVGYSDEAWLNTDARVDDYTPPVPDGSASHDPRGRIQGGADRFLAFLKQELQPALAQRFPIDPQSQSLFGHSFGGLFTLHTLFTQPDAFQCYIASSPSLWWHDEYVLKERDTFVTRMRAALTGKPAGGSPVALPATVPGSKSDSEKGHTTVRESTSPDTSHATPALPRLRLSIGEYEQKHAPRIAPDSQRAQMLKNRAQVDRVHRFAQHMHEALPELDLSMTEYPGATHGSAQMYAVLDALRHACGKE